MRPGRKTYMRLSDAVTACIDLEAHKTVCRISHTKSFRTSAVRAAGCRDAYLGAGVPKGTRARPDSFCTQYFDVSVGEGRVRAGAV
jgi:hypothetical protein